MTVGVDVQLRDLMSGPAHDAAAAADDLMGSMRNLVAPFGAVETATTRLARAEIEAAAATARLINAQRSGDGMAEAMAKEIRDLASDNLALARAEKTAADATRRLADELNGQIEVPSFDEGTQDLMSFEDVLSAIGPEGKAVAATLAVMGAAFGALAYPVASAASQLSTWRATFTAVLGSQAAGEAATERLVELYRRTGSDVDELNETFTAFSKAGIPEQYVDQLVLIREGLQATSREGETFKETIRQAWSDVGSGGVVSAERVAALGEVFGGTGRVFEAIANASGNSADEIRRQFSEGQFRDVEAITRAGIELGEGFVGAAIASRGPLGALSTAANAFLLDISKGVDLGGITSWISELQQSGTFKEITAAVTELVTEISKSIGVFFGAADGQMQWADIADTALGTIRSLTAGFRYLKPHVERLGQAFGAAGNLATMAWIGFTALVGWTTIAGTAVLGLMSIVPAAIMSVATALMDMGKSFMDQGAQLAANLTAGFANGITAGIGQVMAAGAQMATAVTSTVGGMLQVHSPSRVFEQLGRFTAEGMAVGIEGGADAPQLAARDMARGVVAGGASGTGGGARGSVTVTFEAGSVVVQGASGDLSSLEEQLRIVLERALGGAVPEAA
jgi:hypothetical protein